MAARALDWTRSRSSAVSTPEAYRPSGADCVLWRARLIIGPRTKEGGLVGAPDALDTRRTESIADRLFTAAGQAMDTFCVYLGDRLDLYGTFARLGSLTSA